MSGNENKTCVNPGNGVNYPCYYVGRSVRLFRLSPPLRKEHRAKIGPTSHNNTRSSLKNSAGTFSPASVLKGLARSGPVGNAPTPRAGCRKRSQRTAGGLKTGLLKEHPRLSLATVQRVRMRPIAAIRPGASSGKVLPIVGKKTLSSSSLHLGVQIRQSPVMGLSCPLTRAFPTQGSKDSPEAKFKADRLTWPALASLWSRLSETIHQIKSPRASIRLNAKAQQRGNEGGESVLPLCLSRLGCFGIKQQGGAV